MKNLFVKRSILALALMLTIFGCSTSVNQEAHLKRNGPLMNYLRYWFKGYGYSIASINKGLTFGQDELKKVKGVPPKSNKLPFFKKNFLILTSQNFDKGKAGHCLINLGLLKKEFIKGETHFSVNLNCETPFKSLAGEIPHEPNIYSIEMKPVENFETQRSFRFFVETKRWHIATRFLNKGADPLIYINKYKNIGKTPLNIAFDDFSSFYKRIQSVRFINEVLKNKDVINFKEASGKTSLKKYLLKSNRLAVKRLIQEGGVLQIKDKVEKHKFLERFEVYLKEKSNLFEKFYNKLKTISKFPSSVSLK
ncbi:MAG: hypothetical protein VYD54_13500 [Bdellovibrionota bacterium]|nr:hypothetical protein [Bdellovibrionota bacterium]